MNAKQQQEEEEAVVVVVCRVTGSDKSLEFGNRVAQRAIGGPNECVVRGAKQCAPAAASE